MRSITSMVGSVATRIHFHLRRVAVMGVVAAIPILGLCGPSLAVDLTGMTVTAKGVASKSRGGDFTYPLEIYFGTKGNRFVRMNFTARTGTVLIPAGENRGVHRTPDLKFLLRINLQQTATSLRVQIDGSGSDFGYADETWVFEIALGSGSCTLQDFRYTPDPAQRITSSSKEGDCTITSGPPAGMTEGD